MQNYVTDLIQKLQRSLDNNYNVIDMPTVIEIFSILEKTSVTTELLQATRLGKYINELRRRTSDESLAKRAKELVKKWRVLLFLEANGQNKAESSKKRSSHAPPEPLTKRPLYNGQINRELDFSDNSNCSIKDLKKTDVIFINSDSNSSMPDQNTDVNSSSLSNDVIDLVDSTPSTTPKKRGRKKGSKNHKNLLIAAEESFSSKMAVGRNSKVKTTQELLADIQNRTATSKTVTQQDIELRTAQLTESLSRIDQKLNPQKQINKNVTPIKNATSFNNSITNKTTVHRTNNEIQSYPSSTNSPDIVTIPSDDEIVDVVSTSSDLPTVTTVTEPSGSTLIKTEDSLKQELPPCEPLTIEELLSQLPPVDRTCLEVKDEVPVCTCPLPPVVDISQNDRITVQIVDEDNEKSSSLYAPPSPLSFDPVEEEEEPEVKPSDDLDTTRTNCSWDEDTNCAARNYLREKYLLSEVTEERVKQLHNCFLPSVNGNWGVRTAIVNADNATTTDTNIVPRLGVERLPKATENFQKYSISIPDSDDSGEGHGCDRTKQEGAPPLEHSPDCEFREWHETLHVRSYNDDLLTILPYVIID